MKSKFFKAVIVRVKSDKDVEGMRDLSRNATLAKYFPDNGFVLTEKFTDLTTAIAYAWREMDCKSKIQIREYSSEDDMNFLHLEKDKGVVVHEDFYEYKTSPCNACKNRRDCSVINECFNSNFSLREAK